MCTPKLLRTVSPLLNPDLLSFDKGVKYLQVVMCTVWECEGNFNLLKGITHLDCNYWSRLVIMLVIPGLQALNCVGCPSLTSIPLITEL